MAGILQSPLSFSFCFLTTLLVTTAASKLLCEKDMIDEQVLFSVFLYFFPLLFHQVQMSKTTKLPCRIKS